MYLFKCTVSKCENNLTFLCPDPINKTSILSLHYSHSLNKIISIVYIIFKHLSVHTFKKEFFRVSPHLNHVLIGS